MENLGIQEDTKDAVFHTHDFSPTFEKYQDRLHTQISQNKSPL